MKSGSPGPSPLSPPPAGMAALRPALRQAVDAVLRAGMASMPSENAAAVV
jgi:hypothetical protein